jgi:hypothetical protein
VPWIQSPALQGKKFIEHGIAVCAHNPSIQEFKASLGYKARPYLKKIIIIYQARDIIQIYLGVRNSSLNIFLKI